MRRFIPSISREPISLGLSLRGVRSPASAREPRLFASRRYTFSTKACISQEAWNGNSLGDCSGSPITTGEQYGVRTAPSSPHGGHDIDQETLAERRLARILQSSSVEKPVHLTRHVERHYVEAAPLGQLDRDVPTLDIARETMVAFVQRLRETPFKEALANVRLERLGQRLLDWLINSPRDIWDLSLIHI